MLDCESHHWNKIKKIKINTDPLAILSFCFENYYSRMLLAVIDDVCPLNKWHKIRGNLCKRKQWGLSDHTLRQLVTGQGLSNHYGSVMGQLHCVIGLILFFLFVFIYFAELHRYVSNPAYSKMNSNNSWTIFAEHESEKWWKISSKQNYALVYTAHACYYSQYVLHM